VPNAIGEEVDRESHRELSIHVSGEATYPALCRFLSGLEEVERLTRLTSLNVNGSDGGSDVYPVSMTVIIFFAQPADDATQTGALPGSPEDFYPQRHRESHRVELCISVPLWLADLCWH
jgi:hypothetical protein